VPKKTNPTANIDPTEFTLVDGRKVPARGTRWRARWITPEGDQRKKTFDRKIDAEHHLATVTTAKLTGTYVDAAGGKVPFHSYAEEWRRSQAQHRSTTAAQVEAHLRRHVYPYFGARPIGSIRPSHVRAWVAERAQVLSPGTVEVVYRWVSAIFKAAVGDRLIASSPCVGVKLPERVERRVKPLEVDQVEALIEAMPERYRALVMLGAGTGLRQGEAFGLTVDRVDFPRRKLIVDRQIVLVPGGAPSFGPPKTKASRRTVPLPDVVLEALVAHVAAFLPKPPPGDHLFFTNEAGQPIRRTRFSAVWRPAVAAAGLPEGTGFHDLRHFYASVLIDAGESVKVVQERAGHASAVETLNTYSHLFPASEDRTRAAVDAVLGRYSPRVRHVAED